jgi:ClpP class serine protease
VKPIFAVANTMACSAAYHIASQATEMSVTPSGYVGSIGVYMLHVDYSSMLEEAGITETYVFAGRRKVEGNDSQPLGDEAKAAWQAEVDDIYARFVADVAAGRGVDEATVRSEQWGEGSVLLARQAVAVGMCDQVETLEQASDRLRARVEGRAPIGSGAAASEPGVSPTADAGGARPATEHVDESAPEAGAKPAAADPASADVDDQPAAKPSAVDVFDAFAA